LVPRAARSCARHAAGDGWIAYFTRRHASQQILEFANRVLRLRDRHSVPRHDDHLAGVRQQRCGIFAVTNGPRRRFPLAAALDDCTEPNAPKSTLVTERFIAFPISSVSSVPDAPTRRPR